MKILRLYLLLSVFAFLIAPGCKKDKKTNEGPPSSGTRDELTKDSIFLYAKDTYLWNDVLPSYQVFNPRSFSSFDDEINALKQYKKNPAGQPLDKYSFLDNGSVSTELGGTSTGDFGFSVFYNNLVDPNDLRIKYVYAGSPAGLAGLKRGDRITQINNNSNLSSASQTNIDFVVNAIFGSATVITMSVTKANGSTQVITLNKAVYAINPILLDSVYTVGAKQVGYIVFNSFTTNSVSRLTSIISRFTAAGISELIVDLRYNGGGSVQTSEAFTNLIVPASQQGKVMYTAYFNQTMQSGNAKILLNQPLYDDQGHLQYDTRAANGKYVTYFDIDFRPTVEARNQELFAKSGNLAVNRVYFLVTGSTASASELLINNLKPVMDVKLIGRQTYGKPVGFFAIHIDKYDLYIPQFQTKNQANQGDYFDGMAVDFEAVDDVTRDFGDQNERYLAAALNYAKQGTFAVGQGLQALSVKANSAAFKQQTERITEGLDSHTFKGMVENRSHFKRKQP